MTKKVQQCCRNKEISQEWPRKFREEKEEEPINSGREVAREISTASDILLVLQGKFKKFSSGSGHMMANDAVQEGIDRGIGLVEGTNDQNITSEDYMRYYTAVCNICFPSNLHESQQLCDQYKKVFEEYINSKVLPSLLGKEDEPYVTRTSKKVVKPQSLGRFFHYLDRYLTVLRRLPSLKETSFSCFYKLVFSEVNDKVRNAVFSMFDHVGDAIFQNDREWEGEQINQALVKNVIDIYMEMGMGSVEFYEKDFEQAMLEEATAFYSQ